ncbi:carboxylesterase family protein [Actinoplanes sp. NPDC089786]|uniref:carboxylesterase/lipase family protein n=1 Tax=Actinoplanes sp. NPDC089786 TaxID=3155185 RepID=UPI0034321E19
MMGNRTVTALLSAALTLAGCTAAAQSHDHLTARTRAGLVHGASDGEVKRFKGVPYAAPPVDDLRWRAPREPAPWPGVRETTRSGPPCAQGPNRKDAAEDCLYLDVTAPATGGNKPVMVWLHGGGFAEGAGRDYDPRRLVARGDVVVVTVEFRLGLYGFFGAPGLDGGGTFGFQDQQAALRWVRDNIREFGGDPGNVTLFGESGGAIATCAQVTSPGAKGLLRRAIMQSGFCDGTIPKNLTPTGSPEFHFFRPAAEIDAIGAAAMRALGCDTVDCLRKLPVDALNPRYPAFGSAAYRTPSLPEDPRLAIRNTSVPMIVGATRDEHRLTAGIMALAGYDWSKAGFATLMADAFGAEPAGKIVQRYGRDKDVARAWAAAFTDSSTCAQDVPGYARTYDFADEHAQPFVDLPPGFDAGASHASELPNLFEVAGRKPITDPYYTDAQRRLAARMIGYWSAFARTGDPNHAGAPAWPGATGLQLAPDAIKPVDIDARHRCAFWRSL